MNDEPRLIELEAQPVLSIREKVDFKGIAPAMGRAFGEVASYMQSKSIQIAGGPFALYHSWSATEIDVEMGFPVTKPEKGEGKIRASNLPSGKVATAIHIGPYEDLHKTYSLLEKWMRSNGHEPGNRMWEIYLNSPEEVPPEKLMTQMFWPIK